MYVHCQNIKLLFQVVLIMAATWFTSLQNLHNKWTTPLAVEGLYLGNDRLLDMGVTPIYIKDVLSDYSF